MVPEGVLDGLNWLRLSSAGARRDGPADDADLVRGAAVAGGNFAALLSERGRGDEAEANLKRAVAGVGRLEKLRPGEAQPEFRDQVAGCRVNLGSLLSGEGKHAEALAEVALALAEAERLASEYPSLACYRLRLAECQAGVGSALRAQGKRADALAHLDRAVASLETLRPESSHPARSRQAARIAYGTRAFLNGTARRFDRALADCDRALEASPPRDAAGRRVMRLMVLIEGGSHDAAHRSLSELQLRNDLPGDILYELAVVSAVARLRHTTPEEHREPYARHAVGLLARARDAKWFDQPGRVARLRGERCFLPLREREDWRQFLSTLTPGRAVGEGARMNASNEKRTALGGSLADSLFQEAGDGLLLVDPLSERILDANPMACLLSEMPREELTRLNIRGLVRHEQEWQDWLLPVQQTMAFHGKDGFLLRTRRPDKWVPVSVSISRLHPPDGEALALFTLRDRREAVEAYRRAQRTEAELRRVLMSVSDCLWSCRIEPDGRWRYRYLSPVIQKLTGRSVGVFLEDPRAREQAVDPLDLPRWREFVDRLAAGYSGELEYRLNRPDGSTIWVRESVVTAPEEGGLLMHGVLSDVTERKRGEQEQRRQHLQDRSRLDALAALAGRVAHDFNNLLTGVLGHAGLARMALGVGSTVRESIDQMEALTLRAAGLCRELGSFAGRSVVTGVRADLGAVLQQAAEARRAGLPAGVTLEVVGGEGPAAQADPAQLDELVGHLLDNAVDALEGGPGRVTLRALGPGGESAESADLNYSAGELSWLEVHDTGRGVPVDVLARLFEPFYTTRPGRRGVGLSAVLGIVRAHRGAVRVLSRPGEGTRVRVGVPVATTSAASAPAPPAPAGRRAGPPTVLLADDEETVLDVVTRLLQSQGCRVIQARDGEQAIDRYRENAGAVWLALIDVTMPRQDGERVVRQLKALAPDLPVVLMSGFPEADVAPRYADVGLAGYLQKPFRLPALVGLLRELLVLA